MNLRSLEGPNGQPEDDADRVARARAGDTRAFDDLVRAHQDRVYNLLLRFLNNRDHAGEVAERVFINAWTQLKNFKGDSRFSTWLYRIAFNESVTFRRYEGRRRAASIYSEEEGGLAVDPADDRDPSEPLHAEDARRTLERALSHLDDDDRRILLLREVEGLPYEEIAAALDVPVGTVRSRLHRAREALRERLKVRSGTRP